MSIFGDILVQFRKLQTYTQKEFINTLSQFHEEFNALNPVTLSRWENGTTETSLYRKRLILKYFLSKGLFDSEQHRKLIRDRYTALYSPLSKVFEHNYETLIHNLPQLRIALDEYDKFSLTQCNKSFRLQHIIDIEVASHAPMYYQNSVDQLQKLVSHPASYSLVIEKNHQHLGHFIMYKMPQEVSQKLINYELKEKELSYNDLCQPHESGDYYIHALYGVNPMMAAMLNVETYLYLFDNIKTINNIVIFSSRKDGVRLAKSYGIKVVQSGEDLQYDINWSGMSSPVEDILFSDTVLKLVF